MTAPAQQTVHVKDAAAARKRRRRAPAGGASDDCFTCTKRGVKCDRRRPYCSQCLEVGNECSGYKTQLTWGVGVASRGKLRGLSLPIAKAPPVAREAPTKKSPSRARASSTATTTSSIGSNIHWPEHDESRRAATLPPRGPIDIPHVAHPTAPSGPTTPYGMPSYDYMHMPHHQHDSTPPMHHGSWGSVGYSPGMVHSPPEVHPRYSKFPLALVTDGLSSSVGSVNSEVDYMSPMSQSYPREEMPFLHSPPLIYDNYSAHESPGPQSPPSSIVIDPHTRAPTSCPGLVYTPPETTSGLNSHHLDVFESQLSQKMMVRECGGSLNVAGVDGYSSNDNNNRETSQQEQPNNNWSLGSLNGSISQELLSRMPFFMDYYTNTLCPSMVFIDGPSNPFRNHILQLANSSSSLQHAICALSACNLRMRRKLSLGRDTHELTAALTAEKRAAESIPDTSIDDQALSEEYQHRNIAVHLLNQQLNDPSKASHDSVLATILLLCHYRMVESGIAKFHTQFAGVAKIISMRRARGITRVDEPGWMEGLFTHFDAISASINNRDTQLSSAHGGMMPEPQLLPDGAENLVGCDRELFKTISKLGRLNLLAQHRPVQNPITPSSLDEELSRSHSPFGPPLGRVHRGSISGMVVQNEAFSVNHARFDGNGFGAMLDEEEVMATAARQPGTYENHRSAFWKEWKEARLALQSWQFDAATVAANLPGSPSPAQVRDLGSLSEAFRYAALIYIERLANPALPSSHPNFQNLVSQVVYYATSLETGSSADKFLLWPLFVSGSECVNELQQNIVRTKCRDLMSRSGYMNNLSALDVLEKLWASDLKESSARSPGARLPLNAGRRGPFNWAKCIGGAGVDVEWIMF